MAELHDPRQAHPPRSARFPCVNGKVLDYGSAGLATCQRNGTSAYTASVDPVHGHLASASATPTGCFFQVHDLDLARLGVWPQPLAGLREPHVTAVAG
ncbi:hypothetical protein ACLQ2N_13110 [Streptomyces sp. DT224]|uniref:hypothetical protein n=1 Tax=Streptomyces sp. DT224 TaxID=3393426 RepID=UPI003CE7DDBD